MAQTSSSSIRVLAAAVLALLAAAPARADTDLRGVPVGPKKAPIALAAPKDLAAAVAVIEQATGARGEKLPVGDVPLADGRSFALEPSVAERLLEGSHATFKKAGIYLFRYERSFGMAGDKDQIGVIQTTDANAIIRRVGTAGGRRPLTADQLIAWLDALAKEEPFDLWEVGVDYIAGRFDRAPKDPVAVANRCAEFAPDLVAGRASTLDLLATEIKTNRTLYLIW
ncbi:MAG TPA: DUF4253 domain-containing protein [Anaeromyxobacter sp.]